MSKKGREATELQEYNDRVSVVQRRGYTIYRVAKGGYDGEHWGWKHKDGDQEGGFDTRYQVLFRVENILKTKL